MNRRSRFGPPPGTDLPDQAAFRRLATDAVRGCTRCRHRHPAAARPGEAGLHWRHNERVRDLAAREAADRGFEYVIVEDATAELDEVPYEATLRQFAVGWGRVWVTGEAPKNLAGACGGVTGLTAFRDARVEWPKENRDHDRNG